ncbi:hypothetical protein SNE25_05355 [Mucilaginibacter sabulilitoris]|uniref:Adhesin domain-containing protein n=1 Tax=Mucilaginibacter sabulilitoris TaxID=1173583 RepID=A0ABZ0TPW8_9SPHI|nr:hypothetical protein [Mucilaginibacter sabulilitoris]WPU94947.1 hypothetical protein SNE25_05355 [Mucilaginibacter sabulilitoris]
MKPKIFKPSLLALLMLLAMSPAFAQEPPIAKPTPPVPPVQPLPPLKTIPPLNDADFKFEMKDTQLKMKDMQLKMAKIKMPNFKYQMDVKLKHLDKQLKHLDKKIAFKMDRPHLKKFNYKLNDSLDFAYKFDSNAMSQVAFGFKDFDTNFSYNTNTDDNVQDGVEKVKNYSKSYPIDGNDVINLDNRFGKITVNTWTKNEVKVDVQIKVASNDDDRAQKLLDNVTIRDSKDGSGVYFKTNIDNNNEDKSWSLFGGKHNNVRKIEVNYMVYMPAKNPLNVNNKYGSTTLPDLEGKLNINTSYGSLETKSLSNPGNQINVRYGSANIGALNGSDLDVAYGSLNLGECNKLNANISYGSAKIGKITTSGSINVKFSGGLNIDNIDKNVKNLEVNASYSSVKLGISNDQNADFDVTVRYGSFNYGGHDINITSKTPADGERGFNPTKTYKGHLGKGGTDKTITINSSYGSVSFN